MTELFWLVRIVFSTYVAWRLVLMLDVGNPLMGIFIALLFMFGGPFLMEYALEVYSEQCSEFGIYEALVSMRFGAATGFALIGVFLWSGFETVTGR